MSCPRCGTEIQETEAVVMDWATEVNVVTEPVFYVDEHGEVYVMSERMVGRGN